MVETPLLAWLAVVGALWTADPALAPDGDAAAAPIAPLNTAIDAPAVSRPYLYTALETALVIAGGTVWYLRHGSDERWGRAMQWTSWRRKLFTTDEVTFDTDHFNTNAAGHPLDGTVYYQIARGNGLGPGASFVSTVLASTFWEYFVEIPENPSLNDLILTPAAGAVIGEATYRLGRYFAQNGTGTANCAGALLFAPIATVSEKPLCRARPSVLPRARLGLVVGANHVIFDGETSRDEFALGLGADVVSLRGYQRPGNESLAVWPGQWTSLHGDGRFGPRRVDGIGLRAETVWGGRYNRHYVAAGDETDVPSGGPARGSGTMIGFGSVFDYRLRDLPKVHDRIASIGLGGPMFEYSRRGDVSLRLSLSAQYAFAIIGSIAYREDYQTVVGQVIKSPLRDGAYYYGHGVMSAATASIDLGPVGFVGGGRGAWYWSIDEGDPAQSTIQHDVKLRDERIYLSAAVWTRPVVGAFRFGLSVENVFRRSRMLDTIVNGTELNILATTAVGF